MSSPATSITPEFVSDINTKMLAILAKRYDPLIFSSKKCDADGLVINVTQVNVIIGEIHLTYKLGKYHIAYVRIPSGISAITVRFTSYKNDTSDGIANATIDPLSASIQPEMERAYLAIQDAKNQL